MHCVQTAEMEVVKDKYLRLATLLLFARQLQRCQRCAPTNLFEVKLGRGYRPNAAALSLTRFLLSH